MLTIFTPLQYSTELVCYGSRLEVYSEEHRQILDEQAFSSQSDMILRKSLPNEVKTIELTVRETATILRSLSAELRTKNNVK